MGRKSARPAEQTPATNTGGIHMGLFGKIFDKKECCICGGEIGMLGNRKLVDGNL